MKKIYVLIVSVIALAAVTSFEACQSAKSSTASKMLKFDLQNGKGYDYEMTVNMDQEIMGQDMKMDMVTYYSMDVTGEEAGIKTIAAAIDRFRMKTAVAGFNIDIDTDKPYAASDSNDIMAKSLGAVNKVFAAIKGQKFSMKVDAEGKVTEVTGFENMAKKIADSLELGETERAEMMKEFDGQFNADEITQSLQRFWYIFPNKEVKVGDSWQKSAEMGGKMPGKYTSTYKVTDIEGDMVTLEEVSKIEPGTNEKMNLSGEVTGTIVVDSRSGLVVTAEQDMNFKASADGTKFNIKGKSKIKGKAR